MSEWTIAALPASDQQLTYATSWNAAGDGSDIYGPFSSTGELPERPDRRLELGGRSSGRGHGSSPGQTTTVRFALVVGLPAGALRRPAGDRRSGCAGTPSSSARLPPTPTTTSRTPTRSSRPSPSPDASWRATTTRSRASRRGGSRSPRTRSTRCGCARQALNELFQMVFNASFWEAGLVSSTIVPTPGGPRLGAEIPGTHLFFTIDAGERRRRRQRDRRRQLRLPLLHEAVPESRARPDPRVAAADQTEPVRAGPAAVLPRRRPVHQRDVGRPGRAERRQRRRSSVRHHRCTVHRPRRACSTPTAATRSATARTR